MTSRYFRPKGGFFDARDSKLRLDEDGATTRVLADGSEKPDGALNNRRQFVPGWTVAELETLVKAGKWEEIPPEVPAESQNAPESTPVALPDVVDPVDHAA